MLVVCNFCKGYTNKIFIKIKGYHSQEDEIQVEAYINTLYILMTGGKMSSHPWNFYPSWNAHDHKTVIVSKQRKC